MPTGVAQTPLQEEEEDDEDEEQGEQFQFDDSEDENNAGPYQGGVKDLVASFAETGLQEAASSTNINALYSQAVKRVPVTHHEEHNGVTSAGQEGQTVPQHPHITTSPGKGLHQIFITSVFRLHIYVQLHNFLYFLFTSDMVVRQSPDG